MFQLNLRVCVIAVSSRPSDCWRYSGTSCCVPAAPVNPHSTIICLLKLLLLYISFIIGHTIMSPLHSRKLSGIRYFWPNWKFVFLMRTYYRHHVSRGTVNYTVKILILTYVLTIKVEYSRRRVYNNKRFIIFNDKNTISTLWNNDNNFFRYGIRDFKSHIIKLISSIKTQVTIIITNYISL